jgi:hypothetical protein
MGPGPGGPASEAPGRGALNGLFQVGRVVRPLRDAGVQVAERARAFARAAAALVEDEESVGRLTTSFVSSTEARPQRLSTPVQCSASDSESFILEIEATCVTLTLTLRRSDLLHSHRPR